MLPCPLFLSNRSDETETLVEVLDTEEGFSEGPNPSTDIRIREHEKITVTFRGNVTFEDDEDHLCFVFNTNKRGAKSDLFIKEVDRFSQHALDHYRGHVQFWREETIVSSPEEFEYQEKKRILLCELPVTLPKVLNLKTPCWKSTHF